MVYSFNDIIKSLKHATFVIESILNFAFVGQVINVQLSEPKGGYCNYFCIPITINNPLKVCFSIRKILLQPKHAQHKFNYLSLFVEV